MTLRARPFVALVLLGVLVASLLSTPVSAPSAEAGTVGKKGSGGKAIAHHVGGAPIRSAKVTRKAPSARLYRPGLNSTEPTLGVTEDNEIFYSTFQTNTRIEVVRSNNEGATWEIVSPKFPGGRNAQLLSLDPYVYVDNAEGANRVFTIDLTVACSYLSFSDDAGESWTTNPLACGRPVNDHQTLFAGPPTISPTVGYPNVVYYCWNDVGSSSCSKSLDGGLTFIPVSPAYPGEDPSSEEGQVEGQDARGFCGGLNGHGYVGEDGTVYLPRGYCGRPYLSISKDEGATWNRVQVSKTPISGHESSVATDSKGNIYYGWVGRDRLPYLTISKDGGKTWAKAMMIGPPGLRESNLPSIDVGAPGHVAFAYMGSENSPGAPFEEAQGGECTALGACPDPDSYKKTTWNGYMMETFNALDKDPVLYTATVNDKRDPMVRGTCGPGRCKAVYDFIDVVISPAEEVWTAWVDGCILACSVPGATSSSGADGVVGHLVH